MQWTISYQEPRTQSWSLITTTHNRYANSVTIGKRHARQRANGMLATKPRSETHWRLLVCKECGGPFVGDPDRKYCTSACKTQKTRQRREAEIAESLSLRRVCINCGRRHVGKGDICSPCNLVASEHRRLHCKRCGVRHTEPPTTSPRYCDPCKALADKEQRKQDRYNRKQRERAGTVAGAGPIKRLVVFERDNWTCKACGCRCVLHSQPRGTTQATIDHIIPLSKGGTHTYDNVQLLCRECNERKQATMPAPAGGVL